MQFGVARDLITPDVKTHMGGYGSLYGQVFEDIHDDLYVKALLLDDGEAKALLLTLDLLMHDYALSEIIAAYAETTHGVPADSVVVSYTHSHAGPALKGYDPGQHSDRYEKFLEERMKSCIDRACVSTFAGRIAFGQAEGDWSVSRRKVVDGVMRNAPNLGGPKDRTINILRVTDLSGACRALLLNFGCHPVTLGATLHVSAEFPGRLCQLLETDLYGCTALFFQGAGGSSRPLAAARPDNTWGECSFTEVDGMAGAMARSVRATLDTDGLTPFGLDLAAKKFVVSLETEIYPAEYFRNAVASLPDSPARNEAQFVLDAYDTSGNTVDLHAGIVRLSDDLFIAFLCGEVCYEVKRHVERAFGGRKVIFIGYGDGTAYIPDDQVLAEGGYEATGSVIEFCLKGPLKQGIDAKITAAFSRNLPL